MKQNSKTLITRFFCGTEPISSGLARDFCLDTALYSYPNTFSLPEELSISKPKYYNLRVDIAPFVVTTLSAEDELNGVRVFFFF